MSVVEKEPDLADVEYELESMAVKAGAAKYDRQVEENAKWGRAHESAPVVDLFIKWWPDYSMRVYKERRDCKLGVAGVGRMIYGPVLAVCDPKASAYIAMHETFAACMEDPSGATLRQVAYRVGSAMVAELHLKVMKKRKATPKELDDYISEGRRDATKIINRYAKKTLTDHVWDLNVCTHMGATMVGLLAVTALFDGKPALEKLMAYRDGKSTNTIRLSRAVLDHIDREHYLRMEAKPRYLPMVVPPVKWTQDENGKIEEGGYRHTQTRLVNRSSRILRSRLVNTNLSRCLRGKNVVESTMWRVDKETTSLVSRLMDRGGNVAGLPSRDKIDIPAPPSESKDSDPAAWKEWSRWAAMIHETNRKAIGKRNSILMALNIADRVDKYDALWFPHAFDFRGRIYPIPAHLNHYGNDPRRAMLLFAEAKTGYDDRHIKIMAANCWGNGIDKLDNEQRVKWVDSNAANIERFARDPIAHDDWMGAEDPFQFLQACRGLCDSRVGSRIPIKYDGSCNGLQHLSAMGLDEIGGALVNLVPGDMPMDYYRDVAVMVRAKIEEDAAAGNEKAKLLIPFVCDVPLAVARKIVKQPTMSKYYGCTLGRARDMLFAALAERSMPWSEAGKSARYLAKKVNEASNSKCQAATDIYKWLRGQVRAILKEDPRRCIEWLSRVGFPVIQPYWNDRATTISTHIHDIHLKIPDEGDVQNIRSNMAAICAHLTHGCDASHMLETAIACGSAGITPAFVHDSYWTHALDADSMAFIVRDQFIKLHQESILDNLKSHWENLSGMTLEPLPAYGNLDLNGIRDSKYCFA